MLSLRKNSKLYDKWNSQYRIISWIGNESTGSITVIEITVTKETSAIAHLTTHSSSVFFFSSTEAST